MNMNHPLTPERSLTQSPRKTAIKKHQINRDLLFNLLEIVPEEDEQSIVDLLRCESSPIYASRPGSELGRKRKLIHSPSSPVLNPQGYWVDVERNLRLMDERNEAAFTDWIKNEQVLSLSLPHIKKIMWEYELDRIVNGLKWLIADWTLASIAATLKYLLIDDIWTTQQHTQNSNINNLSIAGHSYQITKLEFRTRIKVIMALIDGWNFEHVKELFNFLCTSQVTSTHCTNTPTTAATITNQSAFLLQALLLAFPDSTHHARQLKSRLILSFMHS